MNNLYIVDPLLTASGYVYYADYLRREMALDLKLHLVLTGERKDWPVIDGARLYDSTWWLKEQAPDVQPEDSVIAGSDTAIPYVSSLRSRNRLRENKGLYLAALPERHRMEMFHYRVAEAGPAEALTWASRNLPVFIKPVNGTGSEDVHCVRSVVECREMIKYLITVKGYTELVLQKKHEGVEIQIDMSSLDEEFCVTAIWTARRGYRTHSWLEDHRDLSPAFRFSLLSLQSALRYLDNVYGLYHVEAIFDGTDLKVIEINFRRHGHLPFLAYKEGMGRAQIEADVISCLWPKTWKEKFAGQVFTRLKPTARVWIRNRITKYIEFNVDEVKALPSVVAVIPHSNLFNRVVEPSSEFAGTYLAAVILQNDYADVLKTDIDRLFNWAEARFG